jgi:hypothetical protein
MNDLQFAGGYQWTCNKPAKWTLYVYPTASLILLLQQQAVGWCAFVNAVMNLWIP